MMKAIPLGQERFHAAMGIGAIVFFGVMWVASVLLDGRWSFGNNMISDLGVSDSPEAAAAFALGCIIGGLGLCVSLAGLAYRSDNIPERVYCGLSSAGGFCLVFVGIFNERTPYHLPFAIALFLAAAVALATMIIFLLWHKKYPTAYCAVALYAVSVAAFVACSHQVSEVVAVIAMMLLYGTICQRKWNQSA